MIARASHWTTGQVAGAVSGQLFGRPEVALVGVSTDTRDALAQHLFVALVGERFDAHDFLDIAIEAGAGALLISRREIAATLAHRLPVIVVDDTLVGLGRLAHAHRNRSSARVLALSGSNGKTTTKEMLAAILGERHRVLKTEGNLNNLIGLPMTLLGLAAEHELVVAEMGMNAPGEIAAMTKIARPDAGLITNIGPAHIGMLGSIEAVADAKGELFMELSEVAWAVVNLDDARVVAQADRAGRQNRRTFGSSSGADVRWLGSQADGDGQQARFEVDGRAIEVRLPMPGRHNAVNAAGAIAMATLPLLGSSTDLSAVATGLAKSGRVRGRLTMQHIGPYIVVDDTYNANSASTIAAIETVADQIGDKGRVVALIGEMRELGQFSAQEHDRVGQSAAEHGVAVLGAFGPDAAPVAEAARRGGVEAHHEAEDVDALIAWLTPRLAEGDTILVKGSRGIRMERFIERLREEKA